MNYREAVEYIEECAGYGSVLGLAVITELLRRLGDPQKRLGFIHVAGTNGKGSVCSFLRSVLGSAGYVTGVYMSPAVFSGLETIAVGSRSISQSDYARLLGIVRQSADEMDPHPTVFEMETALAFLYFAEKNCDIVVLECGLGGRGDATNVVDNTLVSVFTSISLDHVGVLGKDIEEIAGNKAGVIKPSSVAVSLCQEGGAGRALREEAAKKNAAFFEADPDECIEIKSMKPGRTVFDCTLRIHGLSESDGDRGSVGLPLRYESLEISLNGAFQCENALLALLALTVLVKRGYPAIDEKAIRRGLKKAVNHGRFELICRSPYVVIDGAHNPDAALRLRECIDIYFKGRRLIFVIGVFADKDYDTVLRYTCDKAEQIITVQTPGNARALPAIELAKAVSEYNPNVSAASSVEEAAELALLLAGKNDVIIAFGSLSYLGRFKGCFKGKR